MKRFPGRFDPTVLPVLITLAVLLVLVAISPADAFQPVRKVWVVELPTNSGVTDPGFTPGNTLTGVSGFSGTSNLQVREQSDSPFSGVTLLDLGSFDYGFYTLAPMNLTPLSGVTPDLSGATYTVRIHEAYGEDETAVGMAQDRPLVYERELSSGDSPYAISFLSGAEALWFEFLSSATAWEGPEWRLIGREARPGDEGSLVVFPEQHSAFGTSGVSNDFTSGGTGYTLPDGAKWFGFFARDDNLPYSTDGTNASSSGLFFPQEEEKLLPREEVVKLGIAGASSSSGTLTMTPYSRRPY